MGGVEPGHTGHGRRADILGGEMAALEVTPPRVREA